MRAAPPVWLLVAASLGAVVGTTTALPALPLALLAIVACLAAAFARQLLGRALALVVAAFALACASAALMGERHRAHQARLPTHDAVFDGVVDDLQPYPSGRVRTIVDVSGAIADGQPQALAARMFVWLPPGATRVLPGDRVRVRGRALLPASSDAPGEFDSARFAFARDIDATVSAHAPSDVVVFKRAEAFRPWSLMRMHLAARIKALCTPREAGLLLALLVGETSLLEPEQRELYRAVGAGHLLAVSGLQVSLLALMLRAFLLPLLTALPLLSMRTGRAATSAGAGAIVLVWIFVGVCGFPPSAVRAGAMASAVLLATLLGRRARAIDALGIAGLGTVLVSPASVLDPSFLLSYGAVVGLVAAPRIAAGAWRYASPLVSTLAAGLITLPISAFLFGEIAPGGLLANAVLVPVASIAQVPSLALGLLGALVGSETLVHWGGEVALLLEALVAGLGSLVGGVVAVQAPTAASTIMMVALAVIALASVARGRRVIALLAVGAALAVVGLGHIEPAGMRVTFLPVGQGDCVVVETPDGHSMIVDGGGTWSGKVDPGVDVVLPFLRRRGITQFDVAVLSHPHPDHALGLVSVLRAVPPRELWTNGSPPGALMDAVVAAAANASHSHTPALLGRHNLGDATVDVFGPAPAEGSPNYPELQANDNSLVLRVCYQGACALLPGDVEALGEGLLLQSTADLHAELVKAGHHGSSTSSTAEFIARTGASHVVFCTGRDNTFFFPHADVVQRWRSAGATLWDTAVHGEITAWLSNGTVTVRGFHAGVVTAPQKE